MRDIYLHGRLRKRYGGHFRLDVTTTAEAVRALSINLPGFRRDISDGIYRIIRGEFRTGERLGEGALRMRLGSAPLHIVPIVAGAKRGGVGKAVLGVALIASAFVLMQPELVGVEMAAAGASVETIAGASWSGTGFATSLFQIGSFNYTVGNLAVSGAMLALGGAASMLAPQPKVGSYGQFERPDQRASFIFSGPVNTSEQGQPIPAVYGQMRVGSVVISAGIEPTDIAA